MRAESKPVSFDDAMTLYLIAVVMPWIEIFTDNSGVEAGRMLMY